MDDYINNIREESQNDMPRGMPNMPRGMPQGMPPGMPQRGMPQGMPQGMPPGMPPGMPQGMPPSHEDPRNQAASAGAASMPPGAPPLHLLQSEWTFYAISAAMVWNIYNKYFKKKYRTNGLDHGCPVQDMPLTFQE